MDYLKATQLKKRIAYIQARPYPELGELVGGHH
jgi:hypothetical protein